MTSLSCARACAALIAAAALVPSTAAAQTAQAPSAADSWRVGATFYGFFPSARGSTRFPVDSGGGTLDISADKVLDSVEFVFMANLDVHNGRWGGFTDFMYLNLGAGKSQSRDFTIGNAALPAGTAANLDLDLDGFVWTMAGQYRVAAEPDFTLDLLGGARVLDMTQELRWSISGSLGSLPPAARTGMVESDASNWDGIVGLKGRLALGQAREWSLPFYLDVGTGESDLTWQAVAGISYAFGWGEISAMWRYLKYEMKSGNAIEDLALSGPMIGATFRW